MPKSVSFSRITSTMAMVIPLLASLFTVGRASASVAYQTTSDWGTGFNGQITIVNDTGAALNNWTLEFDFAPTIGSIWDATISTYAGSHYVITSAAWNSQIPVNGTVSFGFGATPGNVGQGPQNFKLSGTPITQPTQPDQPLQPTGQSSAVSVAVLETGQWAGGFGANLVITNNGSTAING